MSKLRWSIAAAALIAVLPGVGSAKGCLKGAAVGGVVGHVAGHHAVLGAAAGCVVGHHRAKVQDREAAQAAQRPPASAPAPGNGSTNL